MSSDSAEESTTDRGASPWAKAAIGITTIIDEHTNSVMTHRNIEFLKTDDVQNPAESRCMNRAATCMTLVPKPIDCALEVAPRLSACA
jgi:hypothetical protein